MLHLIMLHVMRTDITTRTCITRIMLRVIDVISVRIRCSMIYIIVAWFTITRSMILVISVRIRCSMIYYHAFLLNIKQKDPLLLYMYARAAWFTIIYVRIRCSMIDYHAARDAHRYNNKGSFWSIWLSFRPKTVYDNVYKANVYKRHVMNHNYICYQLWFSQTERIIYSSYWS